MIRFYSLMIQAASYLNLSFTQRRKKTTGCADERFFKFKRMLPVQGSIRNPGAFDTGRPGGWGTKNGGSGFLLNHNSYLGPNFKNISNITNII
jgi:hypothetical protein